MDVTQLIQQYGYLAVALGSFLEGEAVLLAGSVAAYHGHLQWRVVLPVAALASFLGDLPYFFAGRRYGAAMLNRYPSLQRRTGQVEHLLCRHHVLLVLSLRFLYGLRIAGLLAFGLSKMSTLRFLILDFVGAMIWTGVVAAAGYGVLRLIQNLLGDTDMLAQLSLLAAILCSSAFLMIVRRQRQAGGAATPGR